MWNKEYLKNNFIIVMSTKERKNGHNVHILCKDRRTNDYYEVSPKTGRELKNYYCWYDIEYFLKSGAYRIVDAKKEYVNHGFRDYFLMELVDALKEGDRYE